MQFKKYNRPFSLKSVHILTNIKAGLFPIDRQNRYVQGAAHKSGQNLIFKQMNIKSSILKILLNFKN